MILKSGHFNVSQELKIPGKDPRRQMKTRLSPLGQCELSCCLTSHPTMRPLHSTLIYLFILFSIAQAAHHGTKAASKCEEYTKMTRDSSLTRRKRIVGGTETQPHSLPFMAAVFLRKDSRDLYGCGGVLISPQYILTSISCGESTAPMTVRLGLHRWNSSGPEVVRMAAEKIFLPPYRTKGSLEHDIALVKLEREVSFSKTIQPACLNTGELPKSGTITGWGVTSYDNGPGNSSDVLLEATVNLVPKDRCMETYKKVKRIQDLTEGQFCAFGPEKQDACIGDSGGPYFVRGDLATVAGLASFGKGCGEVPGVYTNVARYVDWIENIVWP